MPIGFSSPVSRRTFGLGAVGLAAATVAACSSNGGAGSGTVAYSNKSMNTFFFVVQNEAIKRKSEEFGNGYRTTDAKSDSSTQFNDLNSLLISRPTFLIVDPIDSEGLAPLAEKAKSQKVPVGIVDTPLTKGTVDFTVAFDNRRGGEMAAEKIVELLRKKYGTERGTVLNCYGALSSAALRDRKDGFESVLAKYPAISVLSRPTDTDEEKALSVATATLAEYPTLDAAHAAADSITRGVVTALKAKNLAVNKGEKNHVILVSIDGEPQALQWLRDGILDAEVSQDPVAYGEICVEMLNNYSLKNKPIPLGDYQNKNYFWEKAPVTQTAQGPACVIPPYYIDETNVSDPRQWGNVVVQKWGLKQ